MTCEDLVNNLYQGAGYGIKSYFKKAEDWKLILNTLNQNKNVMEYYVKGEIQ
jgi:hypothetical protein